MPSVADLERALRDEVVPARDLTQRLGVSRATLSRLVRSAGPQVRRLGATRTVRYTRTREISGLGHSVSVHEVSSTGGLTAIGRLHFLSRGRELLVTTAGEEQLFEGLPPFLADMCPQGYLGRAFAQSHRDLGVPLRLNDWTDDHRLLALALRGDDVPGSRIVGDASVDRWLKQQVQEVTDADYPALARRSAEEDVGSSAGGEQPKFAVFSMGRHVLVKFTSHQSGEVGARWRDLLIAESLALSVLREAGVAAPEARWFDRDGFTFLEVVRFDRAGRRGRLPVVSLSALDNEFYGHGEGWSRLADAMQRDERLSPEDAQQLRWRDLFGALIGNVDRHLGNVLFFPHTEARVALAPVYDMLPMLFAPTQTTVVDREFTPVAPTALTFSYWDSVARVALTYWQQLVDEPSLSADLRAGAGACLRALETARTRYALGAEK